MDFITPAPLTPAFINATSADFFFTDKVPEKMLIFIHSYFFRYVRGSHECWGSGQIQMSPAKINIAFVGKDFNNFISILNV